MNNPNLRDEVELAVIEAAITWCKDLSLTSEMNLERNVHALLRARATPPTLVSTKKNDNHREGMLHAAMICRNEFNRAPDAARDHDSVWMGGYESACDHLSIAIEQAAVIDCVRAAPASPLTVPACVLCGHRADDNGRRGSDEFNSFCIYGCGCKCEFPTAEGEAEVPAVCSHGATIGATLKPQGELIKVLVSALEVAINTVECDSLDKDGNELPWYKGAKKALALAAALSTAPTPVEDEKLREIQAGHLTGDAAECDVCYLLDRLSQAETGKLEALAFFGAKEKPDGSLSIDMKRYHASHICANHQWLPKEQRVFEERCPVCINQQVAELTAQVETIRRETDTRCQHLQERDDLGNAIAQAAIKVGIIDGSFSLTGLQLVMLCHDLAAAAEGSK